MRWYLQFPVSYRDLERMLADHGVQVDHTTMYRWVQRFAPELEKQTRRHLRACRGLWHVDEPTSGSAVHGATCTGPSTARGKHRLPAERYTGQEGGAALLPPGAPRGTTPATRGWSSPTG